MSTKHTPGPWAAFRQIVETTENKDGFCCWIEVHSGKNMTTNRDGVSRAEKQANARLIAAAPELLEALKRARDLIADLVAEDELNAPEWIDEAINKAEGN